MNSKDNIFSKFINLIKRAFSFRKALPMPEEKVEETNDNNIKSFKDEMKVESFAEPKELLELQHKFQTNQIQLIDLTDKQLDDLNDLYTRQIEDLKKKIEEKQQEILIAAGKLEASN